MQTFFSAQKSLKFDSCSPVIHPTNAQRKRQRGNITTQPWWDNYEIWHDTPRSEAKYLSCYTKIWTAPQHRGASVYTGRCTVGRLVDVSVDGPICGSDSNTMCKQLRLSATRATIH